MKNRTELYEPHPLSLPPEYASLMPYRYEYLTDFSDRLTVSCRSSCQTTVHFHDALEFIYVESGITRITVGDVTRDLGAGYMTAVSSFVPHGCFADDSVSYLAIIPRSFVTSIDRIFSNKRFAEPIIHDANGDLLGIMKTLLRVFRREDGYGCLDDVSRGELISVMLQTLIRLVCALGGLEEYTGSSALMINAVDYINRHFREDIKVAELPSLLYCNHATLSAQFRRTFGMSIIDYINRLRAAEVKSLLAEIPGLTLKEAAELAGFGSLRTMHRVYFKEYGCTPKRVSPAAK